MKNIYILPTDKPSRLHYSKIKSNGQISYKLVLKKEFSKCNDGLLSGQRHICITSDEEIEEGDWVYSEQYKNRLLFKLPNNKYFYKKIILTTDRDLIKDGVQEIDDEFLEWFVNNSSYEGVVVEKKMLCDYCGEENCDNLRCRGYLDSVWYEIIIPKEEAKTNLEKLPFPELVKELAEYYKNIPLLEKRKEEPKQETLEEARVNNLIKLFGKDFDLEPSDTIKNCNVSFEEGAKWQQEQDKKLYSEEEIRKMFSRYNEIISHRDVEEWQPWIDKQFKKK